MPLIEDVTKATEQDYKDWKRQAQFYGSVSSVVRPLLIICTALVAAEKTLVPYISGSPEVLFVALSIVVAIGTSLDAWLKPRDKWKGFLADRDAARILLMKARDAGPTDHAKVEALLEELRVLEQRHIEKNVY
jgi:hypothetical protein